MKIYYEFNNDDLLKAVKALANGSNICQALCTGLVSCYRCPMEKIHKPQEQLKFIIDNMEKKQ